MTRVELPVFSFLAVLSLLFILPLHLRSRNIPFLFIIAWLLVCNIIQGINAIVWAKDAVIRAEGWCDSVTPVLYALRVALPAVALCVCRQLEVVSSTLDVSYDPRDKYFTSVFHYLMCLVIPVVYAILHFVVQDRRFVLVQEFGCQPAIFPSVAALFLTWLVPLILGIITVFYAGLSFYNYHRRCSFFNQHLSPRSKMTTSMFFRFLSFCLFTVFLVALVDIFDMASMISESGLLDFPSWPAVHQDDVVSVFSKENKSHAATAVRMRAEVIWWMAPITAFALVAVFGSTRECWVAGEHFCISVKKRAIGLFTPKKRFDLPIQQLDGVTVVPLTAPPKAVHDPFKSGWDDTLKSAESLKKQTSFKPKAKIFPLRIPSPASRFPSPTNSTSSAEDDIDTSFAASTQGYLLSPTGKQALERVGMTIFSPKSQSAVDLDIHAESQQLIKKPPVSRIDTMNIDRHLRPPAQGIPSTPETFTSFTPLPDPPKQRENLSVSAWPQPPTMIPLSPAPSPTTRGALTPSPSLAPSPTSTLKGSIRDSYIDYVRQPSPTFAKTTITNRDRAYIFGTPSGPTFTPPPPPRVTPPVRTQQVGRSPVIVSPSWNPVAGGNVEANPDGNEVSSPSMKSFLDSPSIYSTYSGGQPHPAAIMGVVKDTV